jgi:hypothetical protein
VTITVLSATSDGLILRRLRSLTGEPTDKVAEDFP